MSSGTSLALDDRRGRYLVRGIFGDQELGASEAETLFLGKPQGMFTQPRDKSSWRGLDIRRPLLYDVGSDTTSTRVVVAPPDSAFNYQGSLVCDPIIGVARFVSLDSLTIEDPAPSQGTAGTLAETISIETDISVGLNKLFSLAQDEKFQDGMESNLSAGLRVFFRRFPKETMTVVSKVVRKRSLPIRVLCELLYTLGRVENPITKDARLALLIELLGDKSSIVRDAVGIAFSYLDDKRAIPFLKKSIEVESIPSLRADLEAVVAQL